MRIAFSSSAGGGADTHVRTSAQWLAEHGHTIHVIYSGSTAPDWGNNKASNIHIHTAPVNSLHYYFGRLGFHRTQLPGRLKQYETSLSMSKVIGAINSTYGLDVVELFEGYAYPNLFRNTPFIVRLHGSSWTFNRYCEDGAINLYEIENERNMLLAASQIHAPSRSIADFISGACDIPRGKITFAPYPMNVTDFSRGNVSPQESPFRLMMVGRLEKRKGVHVAVRALRKIWQTYPDVYLDLFGKNGDFGQSEIEALISPSEHQGRIHIHGFIPRELLREAYQSAHICLAPTRYETLGYTILEAFACGRPVIASDIGAVPEIVRHKETGWLIPRDDVDALVQTIIEARQERERRELYGREGRLLAERFDKECVMPGQLALYEEAINTFKNRA